MKKPRSAQSMCRDLQNLRMILVANGMRGTELVDELSRATASSGFDTRKIPRPTVEMAFE